MFVHWVNKNSVVNMSDVIVHSNNLEEIYISAPYLSRNIVCLKNEARLSVDLLFSHTAVIEIVHKLC